MMNVTRIGIDLAKQVFQLHGVDERGHTVLRRRLSRTLLRPFFAQLRPCLIGLEACGSAHYWARELTTRGHDVRLIAPQFVAPYRKNDKNDGNDAEAICEAVGRPQMRFVPIKNAAQQAVLTVHRARQLLVAERTALVNQSRGLLAEYGLIVPAGIGALRRALPRLLETPALPALAREVFTDLADRLRAVDERIAAYDRRVEQLARQTEPAQRLMQVPGVGPVTATALVATVGDARTFRNGRQLAAWLGLVPRQHSSGGTRRLGRITKRGDVYLRTLLIHGARAVMRQLARRTDATSRWVTALKARRGFNKAVVALAAKQARILWALLASGRTYQPAATCP
ncbi:MAG: IS110 family transposase [Nitrospirae bacterium]|nr:IS110 family transposase [Nitrospirota bacterium]MDE3217781.1 IS110 family transposase [Nitrospirota bacterium]